jgi:crotonobetainyl-CoA:carnitine CoA-transferase CaiB-like acyl-CoA transferase
MICPERPVAVDREDRRSETRKNAGLVGKYGPTEKIWARCAKALGHPEWCDDPRFATNQARMADRDALEDVMNAVLTTKPTDHWVEVLEAAGVPCGPVYDYAQIFADTQARHRARAKYKRPEIGRGAAHPHAHQDRRGVRVRTVAPKLGQHNAEIFSRLAVSESELRELRAKGVL